MTLAEIKQSTDKLSLEDKISLADYLWTSIPQPPLGPDDEEVQRRFEELESGKVTPLTHEQLLAAVGRQ